MKKVLIIADRGEVESESGILRHAGYRVEIAASLPELDGFDIAVIKGCPHPFSIVKEMKERGLPVIAVLKQNEEELALKLVERGLDDFVLGGEKAHLLITHVLERTLEGVRIRRVFEDAERQEKLIDVAELTAGVVHEIRNPLSIIAMSVEYLVTKMDDNDPRRPFADAILRKVEKIESLIKNLVKFGKAREMEFEPHEVNKLILQVVELIKPRCEHLNIELSQNLSKENPTIKADADSVEEVLLNLFNNAIDVMPGGGTINVRTCRWNGGVIIEVGDTGKGIGEEEKEKVFLPFYSRKRGGVGLGLAISKRIVSDHGGKIWVKNAPQGGAVFKILIPGG